ncbi:MAG: VWA domain-containing protein, partial [Mycobacterium sp.]|nr:VWA domain-containing protein [Mycobacterium sp.]
METTTPRRRRATAFRRAGWLGVVLMASLSLAGPGAAGAAATVVVPGTMTPGAFTAATACGTTPLDVELIIDTSGSMGSNSSGTPAHSRLYWAQQAATQLVNQLNLPANGGVGGTTGLHHVGLTYFSGTSAHTSIALASAASASAVDSAINGLSANGNTPFLLGMTTGQTDMTAGARSGATQVYVFLSDGSPNPANTQTPTSGQIATFQGTADVVWSVAIGAGGSGTNGVNLPLMQSLANPSADFAHATDASTLPDVFTAIYNSIACMPSFTITKGVSLTQGSYGPSVTTTDGTQVYYEIVVTNTGNVALDGVTLVDDHTTLSEVCTIPTTLAIGASFPCDYSSTAADGTTVNTATASAAGLDSQSASASVTGTPAAAPSFTITKGVSLTQGSYGPSVTTTDGTQVYYEIVVTNTGNV